MCRVGGVASIVAMVISTLRVVVDASDGVGDL